MLLRGSEIDSVFDPNEILWGECLDFDSLCYSDSEIDSIFDPGEILQGELLLGLEHRLRVRPRQGRLRGKGMPLFTVNDTHDTSKSRNSRWFS